MTSSHALDDVEKQAAQEVAMETPRVSDHRRLSAAPFFGLGSDLSVRKGERLSDRTGQYCFLCLQGKELGQYAVQVYCFRPTKWRRKVSWTLPFMEDGVQRPGRSNYEKLDPKETACESDAAIYERLKEECFRCYGEWKTWIPFFGVISVREVKLRFLGEADRAGRIPIHIYPINLGKVREEADRIIAREHDHNLDDRCDGTDWHSEQCLFEMEHYHSPCINDQIKEARQRKRKLDVLYLFKDYARNPWNASGARTLDGMAQDSCIINSKSEAQYDRTEERPGIEFTLGWQTDRIAAEVPFGIAWIWFILAIIWLCVIIWGGTARDWATAMAFGQLLAASVSLLFFCVKH